MLNIMPGITAFIRAAGIEPIERLEQKGSAERSAEKGKLRVLIVEDEPLAARLMKECFDARVGCETDVVANGLAAIERLTYNQYALVISDVRMPECDGTELYLWLVRTQPEMARRFVFVTGHADEKYFGFDLEKLGAPIVAKPFTVKQLLATCERYLERMP